ncbi:Serine/threonine-protein kinase LMTK1, partial [Chaetura pelagica]
TSGVFTDFSGDYAERAEVTPALKSLQKQVGTPDSLESLDIPSTASSCEVFSPTAYVPAGQPKALDSGYDTENNESPEFVLKEPHEPREPEAFGQLGKPPPGLPGGEGEGLPPDMQLSTSLGAELQSLAEKNPYRDSAYFSDYDAEAERSPKDEEDSDGSRTPEAEEGGQWPRGPQPAPQGRHLGLEPGGDPCPPGSVPPKTFFLTPVLTSPGEPVSAKGIHVPEGVPGIGGAAAGGEQTVPPALGLGELERHPEGTAVGDAPGGPSTLLPGDKSPPGLSPLPAAPEHREEPEEEEEDTEDSDESDEELRCYNIQEQSEESEEEPAAVPIVVAESQSGREQRLLKMPSLLSESFCEDLERKKKAVSFYDDVTIYLFDQVGGHGVGSAWSLGTAPPCFPMPGAMAGGSSEGPFPPVSPLLRGPPAGPAPAVPALATVQKQVLPIQFSRFTVSPAPVSRFSITHVSDSDMDSIG